MLSGLKKTIRKSEQETFVFEAMSTNGDNDDIRDAILDDTGILIDDEDIEIKKLAEDIPEFDEEKDMEEKLKHIKESFIPETNY